MKKIFFLIAAFSAIQDSSAQKISGSWAGIIYAGKDNNTAFPYFFFLDIQQDGRTIKALYSLSDSNNIKTYNCLNTCLGIMSKKPDPFVNFYKEKVQDFTKPTTYIFCNYINRLLLHYFVISNDEYITGKWFSDAENGRYDGADGLFVLHRISSTSLREVDKYFNIKKRQDEEGKDQIEYKLKPDDLNMANITEQRLIKVMQGILK